MYMYMYICIYVYIYVYIYLKSEEQLEHVAFGKIIVPVFCFISTFFGKFTTIQIVILIYIYIHNFAE